MGRRACFCLLFFWSGVLRFFLGFPHMSPSFISFYNNERVTLTGVILMNADVRQDGVRYRIAAETIQRDDGKDKSVHGNIFVKTFLYPRYFYGDTVRIQCELKAPEPIEDFRYDRYLARYRVWSICVNPSLERIEERHRFSLLSVIESLKNVVAETIQKLWHEPYASFMAGLLYGYRGGLGDLDVLFQKTGVSHIVAVSGYNISIVASVLMSAAGTIGISRKKSFWFVLNGIVFFVLFTGASPSVVRAGIMGGFVLLGKYLGRMSRVGNAILFAAVVMGLMNPFMLVWDIGFQLSFVSTLGLVYLSPVCTRWFHRCPARFGLQETLVSTASAILATLPLSLYYFGRVSLVALMVNMLILWSIPWIMFGGFLSFSFFFLFKPLGFFFAAMSWLGMAYILFTVQWFASLSFSSVEWKVSFLTMFGFYVVIAGFILLRGRVYKAK